MFRNISAGRQRDQYGARDFSPGDFVKEDLKQSRQKSGSILIVEDEAKMRRLLELNLGDEGFTILSAEDAESGLKLLRSNAVDLVVTDLKLPGMDGLEFLQTIKRQNAALPVVVMTAFGSVETAVEAMKAGASDYVLKPFSLAEMQMVIHKELDVRNLREENRTLREALGKRYSHPNIVARSPKMQEVLSTVERVAPTNATVLLGGESGVGKDLIARAIHEKSPARFSRSIALPSRKICWRANCLATKGELSPGRWRASRASSSWRIKVRYSWTRSATCLQPRR
jgi:DNA-binding NtrC family response regulator